MSCCSCVGIGGLEASSKLNYVLVMPVEHAVMLHNELLRCGVKERQIYEVDSNRRPRINRLTNCSGPAAAAGNGGHKRGGRAKRFMPGSIKLGSYAAAGRKYNVTMRSGTVWILMVDRAQAVDGDGATDVPAMDGDRVTEAAAADGSGAKEDTGTVDLAPTTGRGVDFDDDNNDDDDDDDDRTRGNDGSRCKCSNKWCDDCKRSLLREYIDDNVNPDEASDLAGQHACVYKQIVDRIFVVTVTEDGCGDRGGPGDVAGNVDDGDDEDGMTNGESTTADDVAETPERGPEVVAHPTTRVQTPPVPEVGTSTTPSVPGSPGTAVGVDAETTNADDKPKSNTFFSKLFCKKNKKKKKKPVKPLKTE